jgi:hypothetical protein
MVAGGSGIGGAGGIFPSPAAKAVSLAATEAVLVQAAAAGVGGVAKSGTAAPIPYLLLWQFGQILGATAG